MKNQPVSAEHRKEKACVCRLFPSSKVFLRPTHQHNADGKAEVKCWLCGRLAYQTA